MSTCKELKCLHLSVGVLLDGKLGHSALPMEITSQLTQSLHHLNLIQSSVQPSEEKTEAQHRKETKTRRAEAEIQFCSLKPWPLVTPHAHRAT